MKSYIKLIWLILAVIIIGVLPINQKKILAADPVSGDYSYKILEDGTAEIKNYTGSATEVNVPEKIDGYIVSSMYGTFYGNKSIKSVVIPDTVVTVGKSTFYNCSSLESVKLPENLTIIGEYAFAWCENISNIDLPDTVTSIGEQAFMHCSELIDIELPKNLQSIGREVFINANKLESIYISDENNNYCTEDGVLFNKNKNQLILYPPQKKSIEYTIPSEVSIICGNSFSNCNNLNKLTITDGVTSIGESAFSFCSNLKEIYLPGTIEQIQAFAFSGCRKLTDVYYAGNIFEWEWIDVETSGNDELYSASIHYAENIILSTDVPDTLHTPMPSETIVPTVSPDIENLKLGYVDGNENIDAKDALLVLQYAAKLADFNEAQFKSADVDKSGNVNATDALYILQYAARLIDDFDFNKTDYLQELKSYVKENGELAQDGYRYISYDYVANGESYFNTEIDKFGYNSRDDKLIYSYYLPGDISSQYVEYKITINNKAKVKVECVFRVKNEREINEYVGSVSFKVSEYSLDNVYYDDSVKWSDEILKLFNAHVHTAMLYMGDYSKKITGICLEDIFAGYEYSEEKLHHHLYHLFGYSEELDNNIKSLEEYIKTNAYGDGNIKFFSNKLMGASLIYDSEVWETKVCYDFKDEDLYFDMKITHQPNNYNVNVKMHVLPDRTSHFLVTIYEINEEGGIDYKQQLETTLKSREIHYTRQYDFISTDPQNAEISEEYKKLASYDVYKIVEGAGFLLDEGMYFHDCNVDIEDLGFEFQLLKTEK